MKIIVTGAAGFVGKNLIENLRTRLPTAEVTEVTRGNFAEVIEGRLVQADFVFHLAGVNRPMDPAEFDDGNRAVTARLCSRLEQCGTNPVLVLASSIQAGVDNSYGRSKRAAEQAVEDWSKRTQGTAVVFRLSNVFGKWCRPNYNSVVATFCHNIAHDLPINISDPAKELELVYIDDVITAFLSVLDGPEVRGQRSEASKTEYREVLRTFKVTLGELAAKIRSFRESRTTLLLPSFDDALTRYLYATYLSYLDGPEFAYPLFQRQDNRGVLAEFVKSPAFGQIFVSRTKPGMTRGNHFHHTKTEKFFVVEGDAIIRFRKIISDVPAATGILSLDAEIIEHPVSGRDFKVVDIPPGYAHSIENVGQGELVTLFWANEIFDPQRPETYFMEVKP